MAIDLRQAKVPWIYAATISTTWTQVQLPAKARKVTITGVGADIKFAYPANGDPASPDEPQDGLAVGTHYEVASADVPTEVNIAAGGLRPEVASVFIAAPAIDTSVRIHIEGE